MNIPFDNDFDFFLEIIKFAYKAKFPHSKTPLEQGEEMYSLIAEYLGRKLSTRIYTQFFKGDPSISLADLNFFCRKVRKNLLTPKMEERYSEVPRIREVLEYLEEAIKLKKETFKKAYTASRQQLTSANSQILPNVENSKISHSDGDTLEVKSLVEIFFSNLLQKDYKKSWNKISPLFKKYISYSKYLKLLGPIFDPNTRTLFVFNVQSVGFNKMSCEAFFEQEVCDATTYSIFLNKMKNNPDQQDDNIKSKLLWEKLCLHLQHLAGVLNESIVENPSNQVSARLLQLIKSIDNESVELNVSIADIFDAAMIDISNLHSKVPLTKSCFVKLHATIDCEYRKDRWWVETFTIGYIDSHLSEFFMPILLGQPETIKKIKDNNG